MPQGRRVLVVDDERAIAESLLRILTLRGFEAITVPSGEEAIARAATFRPDGHPGRYPRRLERNRCRRPHR